MLRKTTFNGRPVRLIIGPDSVPYVNAADLLDATGLANATRTSHLKRRAHPDEVMLLPRRAPLWKGEFGTRGSATILFLSLNALDRWAQPYPDGEAARALQAIREEHWKPFRAAEVQNTHAT